MDEVNHPGKGQAVSEANEASVQGQPPAPVASGVQQPRGADPGWYRPSPTEPHWRWWDGTNWTDHMTVGPHPEAIPAMLDELRRYVVRMTNNIGFIAGVLKLLVVLWVLGLLLLFFGGVAFVGG